MGKELSIRTASAEDAAGLLEIYRPYVEHTAITFEYEIPTVGEFEERITNTLKRYPYLVAEKDHEMVGYAYVSPFKERAAYDWSVETSIYMKWWEPFISVDINSAAGMIWSGWKR